MDGKSYFARLSLLVIFSLLITALPLYGQDEGESSSDTGPQPEESMTQYSEGFLAHRTNGNLSEAISRLRRAINLDETNWGAYYELGKAYYAQGRNDSAVRTWKKGLEAPNRYRQWFKRELDSHRLRYSDFLGSSAEELDWNFLGRIAGNTLGKERNINPSALQPAVGKGFLSASYGSNKVMKYSDGGRLINTWSNFEKPIDITYHSRLGYLVAEYGANQISEIDMENKRKVLVPKIQDPRRILTFEGKTFVYSDGTRELIQLNSSGDTVVVTWQAPPGSRVEDLALDSDGNFWILESHTNRILVINQQGETIDEYSYDQYQNFKRLWWINGELLLAGSRGLLNYEPGGEAKPLKSDGEIIEGSDLSDIFIRGDRLYVSYFEGSNILIYRLPEQPDPDILIQDRCYHFDDYPIIRLNLIIDDPLGGYRFLNLQDDDFGIHIEEQKSLPSFLRPTRNIFPPAWYLIVDNRFQSEPMWEKMKGYLEEVIGKMPDDTRGSIIELGAEETVQGLTNSRVRLRNALNSIGLQGEKAPGVEDEPLVDYLDRVFDLATGRRGPVGVILFSPHLRKDREAFERLAGRARNNKAPLVVISPSPDPLPSEHSFRGVDEILTQNFTNLEAAKAWRFYNQNINHHFTAVFRSPIAVLEHAEWKDFTLKIHYFNREYDFDGSYALP